MAFKSSRTASLEAEQGWTACVARLQGATEAGWSAAGAEDSQEEGE